jgi:cytochrome c oxidase subunit 2
VLKKTFLYVCAAIFFGLAGGASAEQLPDTIWYYNLLPSVTPVKEHIHHFHNVLMIIITSICVTVAVLLVYVLIRFRAKANPVPSKTTHHVKLEIIWTLIPCLILVVIMLYSFPLMYYMDKTRNPSVTLKVTGYQWYWGYSYPEEEIEEYNNYYIPSAEQDEKGEFAALRAQPTYQRLLSTYDLTTGQPSFVVVPAGEDVRILITAGDVIHSWAMPMMGIKKDAVPGRINETWMNIKYPGIYYGQCSEICGINHGYMPIEVRAVPSEDYKKWVSMMKDDGAEKAMAYIQNITVDYATKKMDTPRLSLRGLFADLFNRNAE